MVSCCNRFLFTLIYIITSSHTAAQTLRKLIENQVKQPQPSKQSTLLNPSATAGGKGARRRLAGSKRHRKDTNTLKHALSLCAFQSASCRCRHWCRCMGVNKHMCMCVAHHVWVVCQYLSFVSMCCVLPTAIYANLCSRFRLGAVANTSLRYCRLFLSILPCHSPIPPNPVLTLSG